MPLQAIQLRGAGAVLHSHSTNAVMATMLDERATEFHVTQLEMVKVGDCHDCHAHLHDAGRHAMPALQVEMQQRALGRILRRTAIQASVVSGGAANGSWPQSADECCVPHIAPGHRGPRLLRRLRGADHREHRARVRADRPPAGGSQP